MNVKLISYTPDPERQIELAYLTCRNLDPWNPTHDRTLEDRIRSMWHQQHFSPFEFADASFYVTGISRVCSHQFVRHRMASFTQLTMSIDNPVVEGTVTPPSVQTLVKSAQSKQDFQVLEKTMRVHKQRARSGVSYKTLLDSGIEPGDARYYLPIGTETKLMVKMNFRSWLHFLRLRSVKQAHWEIRNVANEIAKLLRNIAPNVFSDEYETLWVHI